MSTIWQHKTNRGRVIYDRKPHLWTDRDVERICKAFEAEQDFPDVPMMSDVADRILFWLARRLALDEAAGFVARVVVRIGDILRGFSNPPLPRSRIGRRFVNLFEVYPEGSYVGDQRRLDLLRIRDVLSSMIEYIDQEAPQ